MPSRRTAESKRAALPRACDFTKAFHKDWERLSRSGRYDMTRLKAVMLQLIANAAEGKFRRIRYLGVALLTISSAMSQRSDCFTKRSVLST